MEKIYDSQAYSAAMAYANCRRHLTELGVSDPHVNELEEAYRRIALVDKDENKCK